MRDLTHRCTEPELMDADDLDPAEFAACMKDLARVNSVSLARVPTIAFLDRATRHLSRDDCISVLDVGFGDGDMLRAIHGWARRNDRSVRLVGIDINPRSAPTAGASTLADCNIVYLTGDAFALPAEEPFDFIISSLVAHHMQDADLVRFLAWMESHAVRGWFINDLHRHMIAYVGFAVISTIARWHYIVRHDGLVSIARSFRRSDWDALLSAGGIDRADAKVAWRFPFRFCVARLR